jgi:hypothetical protein
LARGHGIRESLCIRNSRGMSVTQRIGRGQTAGIHHVAAEIQPGQGTLAF